MRTITKLRRSVRAISPVISVLLMIAIAVSASLVAYAWMMGYIGGTTTKVGKAVLIQSMAPDADGSLLVYVQNVGTGAVTVDSVYVKDSLVESGLGIQLLEGQTEEIPVSYPVVSDERIKVKVVTTDGTFSEITDTVGSAVSVVQYSVDFVLGSGGLSMSPSGSQSYAAGAVVAISATPDATHVFSQWVVMGSIVVDDAGAASTNATINGDGSITATFLMIQYQVDFILGAGGASMDPSGSGHFYDAGATVAITATPDGTHTFSQWTSMTSTGSITFDDAYDVSTNAHINGQGNITANFAAVPAALHHFDFDPIGDQQATVAFGITITAKDQYGATFDYDGAGVLSDLSETIDPTDVTFTDGVANPSVTIATAWTDDTITVDAGGKSEVSNAFDVSAAPIPKLVYTGVPQTLGVGVRSGSFTVQRQFADGTAMTNGTTTVTLVSTSGGGHFQRWTGYWYEDISSVTISSPTSFATIYYRDYTAGSPTLTASASGFTSATATLTITGQSLPSYHASITPTSAATGSTVSYTFRVTKDNDGTVELGYVEITVPTGFTDIHDISVSTSSFWYDWHYHLTDNVITLQADSSGDRLEYSGDWVQVTFTATAPSSTGTYQFTSVAYENTDGTGSGPATLNGAVPSVTVSTAVTLTVTTSGTGTGSVTLNPPGGTYAPGTVVTLTANPGAGSGFAGWSGDLSGLTNPTTITMDTSKSVDAKFNLKQTVTLRPNAAGSTTELSRNSGSSPNYQYVDEDPSDESSTYVYCSWDDYYQTDTYNIADPSLSGTITNVRVYIRCAESSSQSSVSARTAIRLGSGSIAYGATCDLSTSWTTYYQDYATKPSELGGGSWTWQNINDLQIGVSLRSQRTGGGGGTWYYARCTQVWVEITYTPS